MNICCIDISKTYPPSLIDHFIQYAMRFIYNTNENCIEKNSVFDSR